MERTYTLQDLIAAFQRRRLLAAAVAASVLVIGAATVLALPSEYRAQSVVQIEPHRLTPDFFPGMPVTSFEDRMRTLKHGLLARPVLERVVRDTKLYPDVESDLEEAIDQLRRNVEVRLEGEVASGPPALLFVVEVKGKDPDRAAKVAELLPRYYAEMTRELLATQAHTLRDTLEKQLGQMGQGLAAQEGKLVAFKAEHASELPEAVESNLRAAGRTEAQIEMRLLAIADAGRRRTEVLAAVPEAQSEAGLASGGVADVTKRLEAARAAYGPDHPDVMRIERELVDVRARRDAELRRYRQDRLESHLARIDAEVREHEAAVHDLQKELAGYQKRVDAAPRWGAELTAMSRDYESLKAKYATTLARSADATAAESLLAADASGLFRVLQPATTPVRPAAPNRTNLLWVALAAAIAAGLAAAAAAEYLDSSLRGPEDAGELGVPVLAAIPRIGPRKVHG